jgi:hypothetical protein
VAPDSVRCTRTVQVRTLHLRVSPAPLRYNSPDCPVCHRTVWCTKRNNGSPAQWSTAQCPDSATVRGRSQNRSQRCTGLSSATRRQASNGHLHPNPNGWVTWLAHRTVRCAHRQQTPPTVVLVVEGYKYPQTPPLQLYKHSTHCIQYKSNRLHSKDTIQGIDLLKVPNSTLAH